MEGSARSLVQGAGPGLGPRWGSAADAAKGAPSPRPALRLRPPPEVWRAPQSLSAHEPLPGGGRRPEPELPRNCGTRRDSGQPLGRSHSLPTGTDDPSTPRSSPARISGPAETLRRLRLGRGQGQETTKCGTASGAQLVAASPAGPRVLWRSGPPAGAQARA